MKKHMLMALLFLTLTACQPAKPQADSILEEKAAKEHNEESMETGNEEVISSQADLPAIGEGMKKIKSVQAIPDGYRNYYEIYVGSFYDSDGDGVGDLQGIIQKLNYISDMGFTGIWLMPIHPSETYHKYDVNDYYSIDPAYGTMEDMDKLIAECKERDIALILDLVVNHTSDTHPWFVEAMEYLKHLPADREPDEKECPYVGYYYFTKDDGKGASYHLIPGTNWYYEGVFWSGMPDLALDREEVKAEIVKVMNFWLDKGISGFRLDAVKEYFTGHTGKNIAFTNWLVEAGKAKKADIYFVGEVWDSFAEITEYYKSKIPSIFNYALATAEGKIPQVVNRRTAKQSPATFADAMVKIEESLSKNNAEYLDALFVANHDNVRMANYFKGDADKNKIAAGMYLTMTGVTFTYYGEEIGMQSSGTKDENKRTAMVWDESGRGKPKNPKNADEFEQPAKSVSVQEKDGDSLLRYYQRALHLRQRIPCIARGKVKVLKDYSDENIAAIEKEWDGKKVRIFYNISKEEIALQLKAEDAGLSFTDSLLINQQEPVSYETGVLKLPPYAIAILED